MWKVSLSENTHKVYKILQTFVHGETIYVIKIHNKLSAQIFKSIFDVPNIFSE